MWMLRKRINPPPLFGCRNSRSYCLSPLLYHQLFFTAHFLRSHCARCNWVLDMCYLCMWGGRGGGRGLECKAEKQLPSLYCQLLNNKSSSPPPRTSSSIMRWFTFYGIALPSNSSFPTSEGAGFESLSGKTPTWLCYIWQVTPAWYLCHIVKK